MKLSPAELYDAMLAATPDDVTQIMLLMGPCEAAFIIRDAFQVLADGKAFAAELATEDSATILRKAGYKGD
jgi:hypothetical protein